MQTDRHVTRALLPLLITALSFVSAATYGAERWTAVRMKNGSHWVFESSPRGDGIIDLHYKPMAQSSASPERRGEFRIATLNVSSQTSLEEANVTIQPGRAEYAFGSDRDAFGFRTREGKNYIFTMQGALLELPTDESEVVTNYGTVSFEYAGQRFAVVSWDAERKTGAKYRTTRLLGEGLASPIEMPDVDPRMIKLIVELNLDRGLLSLNRSRFQFDLSRAETIAGTAAPILATSAQSNPSRRIAPTGAALKAAEESLKWVRDNFEDMVATERKRLQNYPDLRPTEKDLEDPVIRKLRKSLLRDTNGSAALTGLPGVGKTEKARAFARLIAAGLVPEIPPTTPYFWIKSTALQENTKYSGEFAVKAAHIERVADAYEAIWFSDEIHTLRGAGVSEGHHSDLFQYLKPVMSDGKMHWVGATTSREFKRAFAGDPALMRRFQEIEIPEPGEDVVIEILMKRLVRWGYEPADEEALHAIYRYSTDLRAVGAQPAKAIELLESIDSERKLQARYPRHSITLSEVDHEAASLYSLDPAHYRLDALQARLKETQDALDANIIGQSRAKRALLSSTRQKLAGVSDPDKPEFIILVGPPGVGKSALAKTLAVGMGSPTQKKPIGMQAYANGDTQGFLDRLYDAASANPFSQLNLDEIEKAHIRVQEQLLDVVEDGRFEHSIQDQVGGGAATIVPVSTRNLRIVATSNAGENYLLTTTEAEFNMADLRAAMKADGLSAALVDRAWIVPVMRVSREEYREVLRLHVNKTLQRQGQKRGSKLTLANFDRFAEDVLASTYDRTQGGASGREVFRVIEEKLGDTIAEAVLEGQIKSGASVELHYEPATVQSDSRFCSRLLEP